MKALWTVRMMVKLKAHEMALDLALRLVKTTDQQKELEKAQQKANRMVRSTEYVKAGQLEQQTETR